MASREKTDDAFYHWLAGFIDGEGSFLIRRQTERPDYRLRFAIRLRIDDLGILNEIADRTGLGSVRTVRGHSTSLPQAVWIVETQKDCLQLVELLQRFPLRAKKRRDFAIWRQAVLAVSTSRRIWRRDWSPIAAFADELRSIRVCHLTDAEEAHG